MKLLLPALLALAPAQDPDLQAVTARLEREIEDLLAATGIPSVSIALVRDGEVAWAAAFGYANVALAVPATPDTYYCAGSTFKLVTATAVMQGVERGELTLDTPLNELVGPERAVAGAGDVTLRHLLAHTSALDAFEVARRFNPEGPVSSVPLWSRRAPYTPEELLANTRRTGPAGAAFDYCNDCYAIAGLALETAAGRSLGRLVAQHVYAPLGIEIERPFRPSPHVVERMALPYEVADGAASPIAQIRGDAAAAGDVYLRASDMARVLAAHLSGGEYGGARLLSAASVDEMHRQQFDARPYGLGIGLARFGEREVIHHGGGVPGFRSFLVAEPATRQGVYVMSNALHEAISPLARFAMQLLWGEEPESLTGGTR